jgi:serine/threonine-protein kinase
LSENQRVIAGRYEVGNLIGRGGMADVYEGVDTRLGRTVAIKLLKADLANDPNFEARFRQEAQASARMAHPTIVRVYDAGEDTVTDSNGNEVKHPFIIMEFVSGKLLRDLLHERRLTRTEVIDYASGVLTALEFSHRAGVIHRDIKAANVMITDGGLVKVMDFGIARAVSDSSATMAHTTGIMGTAQYFSPEQAKGETVDSRTDLYSAGVLLFEMLAGRPPFKGETAVSVAYQHVSEAVPAPSSFDSNISPELDAVVLRALAKDRNDRFQTAEEFREHLVAAANGSPATAATAVVVPAELPAELPVEEPAAETPVVETPAQVVAPTDDLDDFEAMLAGAGEATTVMPQAAEAAPVVAAAAAPAAAAPAAPIAPPTSIPYTPSTQNIPSDSGPATNPFATLGVELPTQTSSQPVTTMNRGGRPSAGLLWGLGSGITVVLVGLVVWLIALGGMNFSITPGAGGIPVADVTNSTYFDGYNTLTEQGLLVTKLSEASDTVPVDTIIRTDPIAGTSVPEKTLITVYVSSGKNTVRVPTLIGLTESEAATALITAKLALGTITQANSASVEAGKVIESDPVLNTEIAEGTVVNLIISNGKVLVPDVRNLDISEARNIMTATDVGLTVSITTKDVCAGTQGTIVTDQSILPGLADQRSAIILYVACNP